MGLWCRRPSGGGVLSQKIPALFIGLAVVITAVLAVPVGAEDNPNDILVVVNKSVKTDTLSKGELRDIFLKRRKIWQLGQKVVPVNAKAGLPIRKAFRQAILNMSKREEDAYWQKQTIMTAEGEPVRFGHRLKAVFKLRGSVSYVYRYEYREGVVKVLMVIPAEKPQ